MQTSKPKGLYRWLQVSSALGNYLIEDFVDGPKVLNCVPGIRFRNVGPYLYLALLLFGLNDFSTAAWIYLGLHAASVFFWSTTHCARSNSG